MEVALALGVLSFAILPMMGLIASGFNGYRSAMDRAVEAAIVQRVRADAARLVVASQSIPDSYYTDDGTPTTASDSRAMYRVGQTAEPTKFKDADPPTSLPRMLLDRYTITHLPSGAVHASGFIHVTPR